MNKEQDQSMSLTNRCFHAGNGKTISIKAMMHSLYHLKDPVPTLYVRTLTRQARPPMIGRHC